MNADNLLSGLIGAVIATALSIVYLFFSEEIKRRCEVYLAVVKYIDDIYIKLQAIFAFTHFKYTSKTLPNYDISGLSQQDIHKTQREVTELILAHGIRSQVALVYGDSKLLHQLSELFDLFITINQQLSGSTKSAWVIEHKEIFNTFEDKVDPIRNHLQEHFRSETSLWGVITSRISLTCRSRPR